MLSESDVEENNNLMLMRLTSMATLNLMIKLNSIRLLLLWTN